MRPLQSRLITAVIMGAISVQAQTISSVFNSRELVIEGRKTASRTENDVRLASHAIAALRQLHSHVIVYESLFDFETNNRVANVSLEIFNTDLARVTQEVELLLSNISNPKLQRSLTNALCSYRDGAFWWSKLDRRRVVPVQELRLAFKSPSAPEAFLNNTVPYTVVIHWRQANKFLLKAEQLITPPRKPLAFATRYEHATAQSR